jgi:hypothetical protein
MTTRDPDLMGVLVFLLHNLLAERKYYVELAVSMGRSGLVLIVLHDGHSGCCSSLSRTGRRLAWYTSESIDLASFSGLSLFWSS